MLKGTLDDFTLPDMFRLMSLAKKTGRMDVSRQAGTGKVYFRDGEVYYAESSLSKEPLGQKLVRGRVLTEGQLNKALDQHAQTGKRVGTILVESGLVTAEQIEGAVQQQIEDAVFDLLRWELGEFAWEGGAELDVEVPIAVSVENLIMEASRRLDELEVIQRKIPSTSTILMMAPTPPEGAAEINITPDEWRVLVLVDGNRTVAEIADFINMDDFDTMRILYGLLSAGLIEVDQEATAASVEVADEPIAEAHVAAEPEPEIVEPEPEIVEPVAEVAAPAPEAVAEVVEPQPEPVAEVVVPEPEPAPEPVAEIEIVEPVVEVETETVAQEVVEPAAEPVATAADDEAAFEDALYTPHEATEIEDHAATAPDAPPAEWFEDPAVPAAPAADAFLSELLDEAPAPPAPDAPPAPEPVAEQPQPAKEEAPSVDRAAVVRELAGLFDEDRPRSKAAPSGSASRSGGEGTDQRKRVEDDDQVTKGLVSRLIKGVKGL